MRHHSFLLGFMCFSLVELGSSSAPAVSGAELVRNEPLRYGRFEARVQFAPGSGVISSFFLWKEGSEMPDVFWNEIDIEKVGASCTSYSSNALYGLPQANHVLVVPNTGDLCTSYHTHIIEWTPDYLIWLFDGVETRRLTGPDLQAYEDNALSGMQIRFNLWVGNASFGGSFAPEILPVHQYLNWIAYWDYTPGAGEGGGDFTLLWREDFDAPLDGSWTRGTWASPFNLSIHSPNNINIVDGKLILSLTADDAAGFTDTPPVDDVDLGAPSDSPDPTSNNGGTSSSVPDGAPPSVAAGSASVPGSPTLPETTPARSPSSSNCSLASSMSKPGALPWTLLLSLCVLGFKRYRCDRDRQSPRALARDGEPGRSRLPA